MFRINRAIPVIAASAAAAFSLAAVPASAEEMSKGEKKLAKLLEGREAGEPTRCISDFKNRRLQVIDDTALVYGSGKTIYVQRTKNPKHIDRDEILVVRKFGSTRLCRLDIVNTVDRFSGIYSGSIFFEDFVPYTRVEEGESADS